MKQKIQRCSRFAPSNATIFEICFNLQNN